ncbi:MAG: ATPase [Treponema sp.]|nr:ATPase [Treponema sp.]
MTKEEIAKEIEEGGAAVGIEFGSTRIKAVLIDSEKNPQASGGFTWENSLADGIWTYSLQEVENGIRTAYAELKADVKQKFGVKLSKLKALGISAMMHGYLAFDKNDNLLVPFRTWRNTITGQASRELTELFNYPVPERWSISHYYQAILKNEPHVPSVEFITTLAGYVHFMLTGQKVLGTGDASGMFPIDANTGDYDKAMAEKFDALAAKKGVTKKLLDILPKAIPAGKEAGKLTKSGAAWLDPDGDLGEGVLCAPPEGDAGTGMVATNAVAPRTGNVSAGTSVFAMVVLEKALSKAYPGVIDIVTTPDGKPTAMVHVNTCTAEFNKWVGIMGEAAKLLGAEFDTGKLYDTILGSAKDGDKDCGGVYTINYISGEGVTDFSEGRPMVVRSQDAKFNLANFMRSQIYSAVGTLRLGMDVLFNENVKIDSMTGHGGYFKTEGVGLETMAAAMHTPISAMETAGEGGPWGMALLAAYAADTKGKNLGDWLESEVFASAQKKTVAPDAADVAGFDKWLEGYKSALKAERTAVENLK